MKQLVLKSGYFLCHLVGVTRLFYFINRSRRVVLTYHNVIPDEEFDASVHLGQSHRASVFERHLSIIKSRKGFAGEVPGGGGCAISFDDGYRNNYLVARAILARYGIKACFFVPLQPVQEGGTLIIDQVAFWFSYVPTGVYLVADRPVRIDDSRRLSAYADFYAWLSRTPSAWSDVVTQLDSAYPFQRLPISPRLKELRFSPMTKGEIDVLKAEGHEVGCHSWSHLPLASLDEDALAADFARCATALDHLYNTRTYCYPFGGDREVTPTVASLCKAAGFAAGMMNVEHVRHHFADDRFAIPRLSLPNDANSYVVHAKLSGFESFVKRLLGR